MTSLSRHVGATDAAPARGERPLVLGQIGLSFHVASAAVVRQVLAEADVAHTVVEHPHEQMFEMLANARIDMVVSAWLPGSHGDYLSACGDDVVKLGVLYEPHAIWGVPDYVPISEVASLQDLAKAPVVRRMDKVIQGIGPGAGISRFSREIVERYRLDLHGYEFRNGTLAECVGAFEAAVAERRWVVLPLWHPQYLHQRHRIRALADPEGLLRGKDAATIVLRREAARSLPPAVLARLARMSLGNAAVTELDDLVGRERLDPFVAARRWMDAHPGAVKAWD
jgi:glycine betaine/proline transport system substrate-binding protein